MEKRFLEAFLKGQSKAQAAIQAGYTAKNASEAGRGVLRRLQTKFPDLLDNIGISVEAIALNCLKPALVAMKVETASFEGKITDVVEFVDHRTRLQAADIALKIHGAYASKEQIQKEASSIRVIKVDMPRPIPPPTLTDGNGSKSNGGGTKK